MTYNKSEIMKKAWSNYRANKNKKNFASAVRIKGKLQYSPYTFSDALKAAWKDAKYMAAVARTNAINAELRAIAEAGALVKATELNVGDKLFIEYGAQGNYAYVEVTGVSKSNGGWFKINSTSVTDGRSTEFCMDDNKTVKRYYTATIAVAA